MIAEILPRGTEVRVIGLEPDFPHHMAPQPQIGITGRVAIEDHRWYTFEKELRGKRMPVEFKAVDLGIIWEEGDDPDWEYVCMYMALDVLELK